MRAKVPDGVHCVVSALVQRTFWLNDQRPGPSLLLSVADGHSCPNHMAMDGIFDNSNLRE